jgi:hypothetical protein
MAVAIRRPIRDHPIGNPHRAILGDIAPGAIGVQLVVADHFRGNISRHIVGAAIPLQAPIIEIIVGISVVEFRAQLIGAGD